MIQTAMTIPQLELDLFANDSLRNPFGSYRQIRDAGPVVYLKTLGVYAIARFADVQKALRSGDVLISGQGNGFSEVWNSGGGRSVLQMDGQAHSKLRATIMRPLTPGKVREARVDLKGLISERIAALTGTGTFNAMRALASFLPIEAVSHLVGLPEVGRERMLDWAAASFNLIGPNPTPQDVEVNAEAFAFIGSLGPSSVRSGSWAADLFAAVDSGRLSLTEAMQAISAYVIPSLDTTILAKGHLLHDLATHPDQWAQLKRDPSKIPAAVSESVRRNSVLRFFARVASNDYQIGEETIPAGARVMLLYGAANRDERRYADPDRFDIERDARDQLAWGTGTHMCAGMHLARLEMEVMLEALVEADATLHVGTPTVSENRGLYGYVDLPLRIDRGQSQSKTA